MGWIVKLGTENIFGSDVFSSEASARYALVHAIKATKNTRDDIRAAMRYTKAKIVRTDQQPNVTTSLLVKKLLKIN